MTDIPVVVTSSGAQPTPPSTLLADLIASVSATNPGYTANLTGSLIQDVSQTDVGALLVCDTARVEAINSITPYGANDFVLAQLGQIYIGPGAAPAIPTNTSVFVQFTVVNGPSTPSPGTPVGGQVIAIGVTVSDGIYQYIVQDGGVTNSSGQVLLFCQAAIPGSWAVASGTVDQVITSFPSQVTVTCTNPQPGTASAVAETNVQYRSRVLQAGQAISQGMTTMLKTLLGQVSGVQQRLISVLQQTGGGWEVICGGGDPYQVAGAIFDALFDVSTLVGSTMSITNITQANPGQVTTLLNHGYSNGQVIQINGVLGMLPINGINLTITVVDEKNFTIGINTTGFPAYISGGVVTPNLRNISVNISDFPDVYTIPFVNPPAQTFGLDVLWNTTEINFVAQASVAQAAAPALAAYVNSIVVGQPFNILVAEETFTAAVAGILQPSQISVLDFTVTINGVVTAPQVGTNLVFGDPESSFNTPESGSSIIVTQA